MQPSRRSRKITYDEGPAPAVAVDVEDRARGHHAKRVRDLDCIQATDLIFGKNVGSDKRLIDATEERLGCGDSGVGENRADVQWSGAAEDHAAVRRGRLECTVDIESQPRAVVRGNGEVPALITNIAGTGSSCRFGRTVT